MRARRYRTPAPRRRSLTEMTQALLLEIPTLQSLFPETPSSTFRWS